jgi:hypothetical protein
MSCHDDGSADSLPASGADQTRTSPFIGSAAPHVIDPSLWGGAGHNRKSGAVPAGTEVSCIGDGTNGCHASGHGTSSVNLLANATDGVTDFAGGPAVNPTQFCFNCHTSGGTSSKDVEADFPTGITGDTVNCDPDPNDGTVTGTGLPCNFQEDSGSGAPINQRHDILAEDQTYSGGAVSCANCHAPHADNSANPVADVDTGEALPSYNFATYAASGDADPSFGVTQPDYIQFCLACHDNSPPTNSGVVLTGMVDISSSYVVNDHHGSVQGGGSGNGYLKPPYDGSDSVTYAPMNCTDCHGAHGSPNIFNLKSQITIGGTVMTVGGWTGDGVGEVIGDGPPGSEQTVYYLPRMDGRNAVDASGVQEDHQWGAWCSFCHQMQSHGRDETVTCTAGHMQRRRQDVKFRDIL